SIQISPLSFTAIRILARGLDMDVLASGRFTSIPVSFTNDAVTMKKMSIINTTSSIGVISISPSSACGVRLENPRFIIQFRYKFCLMIESKTIFQMGFFAADKFFQQRLGKHPGNSTHHTRHGRNGG